MDWLFALHNKVKQNLLYSVFFVFDISHTKKKSLMSLCDVVMADLMKCLFAAKPKCIWRVVVERNSMPGDGVIGREMVIFAIM